MAIADNTLSMSTMFNALQQQQNPLVLIKNYPKDISGSIPPPGFTPRASVVKDTRLEALFDLMTSGENIAQFKDMITKLDKTELLMMASLLTSDSDYFTEIVKKNHGSRRVQRLLGKSDDVDSFFLAAILRDFLHIMTSKYAAHVAVRAMAVFSEEKKQAMYEHTLHHALDIARNQYGCIALNDIITDADDLYNRDLLLDLVAFNALSLSKNASGNFVVQHLLKLNDLRSTHNVAVSLRGHCVDLSFKKYGSYIVEQLLEAAEELMLVVVLELLECDGDRLMRLARHEFGNFVVCKALSLTKQMIGVDLFWGLVHKLMPFFHLLRRSHGSNIANILESILSVS